MSHKDQDLKSFHSFLLKLENGVLNEHLTEAMKKAIEEISDACMDRGGKHKATIALKIEFIMDQRDKVLEVNTDLDTKLPKAPRGRAGMFFVGQDGFPSRENPRQLTLEDELERQRLKREEAQSA